MGRWGWWIVLLAAVAVRLPRLVEIRRAPEWEWSRWDQTDCDTFARWARHVAGLPDPDFPQRPPTGPDWLSRAVPRPPHRWEAGLGTPAELQAWEGGPAAFRHAPLYPYGLAALWRVTGENLGLVLLLQFSLGICWALASAWCAYRAFGPVPGVAAGVVAGVYGPALFVEGLLLRDGPALLLQVLATLAVARAHAAGRPRDALLAGAALVASTLLKEANGPLAVGVGAWLAWDAWRRRDAGARRTLAWVAVGGALAFAPVVVRNLAVGAPALQVSSRGGLSLALANAPDTAPRGIMFDVTPGAAAILRKSGGGSLATLAACATEAPGRLVGSLALRAVTCATGYEGPDNASYRHFAERSTILTCCPGFPTLLGLGLVGIGLVWRRGLSPLAWLCLAQGVALACALPLGLQQGRYKLGLVPALLPFAGCALAAAFEAGRAARWNALATLAGSALAIAAVCSGARHVIAVAGATLAEMEVRPIDYMQASQRLALGTAAPGALAPPRDLTGALAELDRGLARFAPPEPRMAPMRFQLQRARVGVFLVIRGVEEARAEAQRWAKVEPLPEWAAVFQDLGLPPPR